MNQEKYKIISVVGARPQFIKLAAFHNAVSKADGLDHIIVHSGQHYDETLSESFFHELNIPPPNYNLGIGSESHNIQIARCINSLDSILAREKPDMVVVFGDTNTTAAAAIAAAKRNIHLAHIEAGLREFDKSIPEEVNKLITDAITDLYFTPTQTGVENLKDAGITKNVFLTGDISLDLLYNLEIRDEILKSLNVESENYILLTCHRDANTSSPAVVEEIISGVAMCGLPIVFPMHPRTKKAIENFKLENLLDSQIFHLTEAQGFYNTQQLIKHAAAVITDSGGIIKETYFYKVHGIITDKQTEWVETVNEGWNTIAGPDRKNILNAFKNWQKPLRHSNCLGDGKAAHRIVKEIIQFLHARKQENTHSRPSHG